MKLPCVALILATLIAVATAQAAGGGPCLTNAACVNGECDSTAKTCVCFPGWFGSQCTTRAEITAVNPSVGNHVGGDTVTVTVTGATGTVEVAFGDLANPVACTEVTAGTTYSCVTPASGLTTNQRVPIEFTLDGGQSWSDSPTTLFIYTDNTTTPTCPATCNDGACDTATGVCDCNTGSTGPLCDATLSAASTNPSTLLYYEARGYKGARVTVTGTGFQAEPAVTRCIFNHGSSAAPTSAAQVEAGDYYVSKATFVSATEVVCQPRWGHSGPASFSVTTNMVDFAAASTSGFAAMPARATGTVMEEYYRYNGGSIDGFLASNLYPYAPDVTMTVTDRTTFGIPNEGATTPHVRIQSGYLQVPANGDYTFLIASLDEARLYLSTDASPANLAEIARNDAPTSNLTATAQQQSTPQTLVAGHTYAVAVIYRAANTLELQVVMTTTPANPATHLPIETNFVSPGMMWKTAKPPMTTHDTYAVINKESAPYSLAANEVAYFVAEARVTETTLTVTVAASAGNPTVYGCMDDVPSPDHYDYISDTAGTETIGFELATSDTAYVVAIYAGDAPTTFTVTSAVEEGEPIKIGRFEITMTPPQYIPQGQVYYVSYSKGNSANELYMPTVLTGETPTIYFSANRILVPMPNAESNNRTTSNGAMALYSCHDAESYAMGLSVSEEDTEVWTYVTDFNTQTLPSKILTIDDLASTGTSVNLMWYYINPELAPPGLTYHIYGDTTPAVDENQALVKTACGILDAGMEALMADIEFIPSLRGDDPPQMNRTVDLEPSSDYWVNVVAVDEDGILTPYTPVDYETAASSSAGLILAAAGGGVAALVLIGLAGFCLCKHPPSCGCCCNGSSGKSPSYVNGYSGSNAAPSSAPPPPPASQPPPPAAPRPNAYGNTTNPAYGGGGGYGAGGGGYGGGAAPATPW